MTGHALLAGRSRAPTPTMLAGVARLVADSFKAWCSMWCLEPHPIFPNSKPRLSASHIPSIRGRSPRKTTIGLLDLPRGRRTTSVSGVLTPSSSLSLLARSRCVTRKIELLRFGRHAASNINGLFIEGGKTLASNIA